MHFILLLILKKSIVFLSVYSTTPNELTCLMSAIIRALCYTEKEAELFSKVLFTTYYT